MRVTVRLTPNSQPPPEPPPAQYSGYRVLHKAEGGWQNTPLWMPEVMPPISSVAVKMTEAIQRMSYDLMRHFNPLIDAKKWTAVHAHDRAFTNGTGFGDDTDPRANYITGDDIGKPLPAYDKCQRVCGGSFVRGTVRDNTLVIVPGVHAIDARQSMPSVETIVKNNWYIYAVTVYGDYTSVGHFPQGGGGAVVIPLICDREISFEMRYFERWDKAYLPDPLKIGG